MGKKRKGLFFLFLIIFIGAVAFGLGYSMRLGKEKDSYQKLAEEAHVTEQPAAEPTDVATESTSETTDTDVKEKPVIPIDFDTLREENPEIYAWIQIPDTEIDYPVAQRIGDDAYYLNHTIDGTEGLPGSIYTEAKNRQDFSDFNTVIYGHKMKNGTMFGTLTQYEDPEFMEAHPQIIIYTPEHIFTYEVFAAVTFDNRHLLNTFDFSTDEGRQNYFDTLRGVRNLNTHFRDEVSAGTNDRILTLSTCNGNDEQRFLVEAVLKNEE